uniref:L,D-transpeptidase n=1 Tax=Pararhizobium sp. IMCC3301 TaxID=3067904 RepID=UPI0027411F8C|nr:L,D-transpeptidase [Pararhizobium sp. IMCC3301]
MTSAPPSPFLFLSRRSLLLGSAAVVLAACTPDGLDVGLLDDEFYTAAYGPRPEEEFPLPALDVAKTADRRLLRQVVRYETSEKPGTVVVDPANHYLYLVHENNYAMRYGVGVGKAGMAWSGRAYIAGKRRWPSWRPPAEMIERRPELQRYGPEGMAGGPDNPLGARALYLFEGDVDTLYRIHGTPEPDSIGKSVSSGCIRMWNQDVIDLYERVGKYTPIIVLGPQVDGEASA